MGTRRATTTRQSDSRHMFKNCSSVRNYYWEMFSFETVFKTQNKPLNECISRFIFRVHPGGEFGK